jgi:hypothetical protein
MSKTRCIQLFREDFAVFIIVFAPTFSVAFVSAFSAVLVFVNTFTAAAFPTIPASIFIFAG